MHSWMLRPASGWRPRIRRSSRKTISEAVCSRIPRTTMEDCGSGSAARVLIELGVHRRPRRAAHALVREVNQRGARVLAQRWPPRLGPVQLWVLELERH